MTSSPDELSPEDCTRRLDPEPAKLGPRDGDDSGRSESRRDYDRILHSGAFRRLQGKTQVVAPYEADFFRTRMTHTLECAQIGGAIARRLGLDVDLVQAACLAHDLGHPPFGHTGEEALQECMKKSGGFEGNAQSFRIVTRLETKFPPADGTRYGLNLCRATLASMVKYPWGFDPDEPKKKFGYYADDAQAFEFAWSDADSRRIESGVMEWADDTAYAVHDLGDGIRAGFVDLATLRGSREEQRHVVETARANGLLKRGRLAGLTDDEAADIFAEFLSQDYFSWCTSAFRGTEDQRTCDKAMTSGLIEYFMGAVSKRDVPGKKPTLVIRTHKYAENRLLAAVTFHYIIRRSRLRGLQLGQKRVAKALFAFYLKDGHELLPRPLRDRHELARKDGDKAGMARVVCDHVAGMTDRYAVRMYERLRTGHGSLSDLL